MFTASKETKPFNSPCVAALGISFSKISILELNKGLLSLGPNFLICKMEIIIIPHSQGNYENEMS